VKYYRTRRWVFAHRACYLCPVFTEIGIGRQISVNIRNIKPDSHDKPGGRTDRREDRNYDVNSLLITNAVPMRLKTTVSRT
jgi:hypothetical protein